ncbi:hypothetical protein [Thalassobellus suaedae]|uniref:Uncharacterized protein n=1 Tax=Thalassobellus suaedae TaxID=3074124 RepID=A0ABY9XWA9_9FLAO|nr:hypothetical protein RHP51_04905 [Flavobacteriaceae bacterium HL-DH14]
MIDRIFKTAKFFLNTDGRGNFKPEDFDTVLHNKVLEKFEDNFFEVNQMINRQNRGLINGGLENIPDKIRERIQHYITPDEALTYSATYFNLPDNLHYFDTVEHNGTIIELLKSNREFKAVEIGNPSEDYPIGLKQGNTLKVRPSTIVANVTMSYLRKPIRAKWTHQIINSVEVFDNGAPDFKNVDIHASEEVDLTLRILSGFGLNLKEKDIQDYAQREEATNFNQEKSS